MTAEEFACVFFDRWYCENGCPSEIISDRDKLFISKFWRALMKLTRIKHKLLTAYHPQTDGASKCSNKTVIQCLQFHVKWNQQGWARALPKVRFHIMNTINSLTGLTPFMLKMGCSPWLLPPLLPSDSSADEEQAEVSSESAAAHEIINSIEDYTKDAHDALLHAKICQAHEANKSWSADPEFEVSEKVFLATAHCCHEYMQAKDGRVAKFMPHFNRPFEITAAYPESPSYRLLLPPSSKIIPTFHAAQLRCHVPNDDNMFPERAFTAPGPVVTEEGSMEYFIKKILDKRAQGRGHQYLIRWLRYGPEHDLWLPQSELINTETLLKFENTWGREWQ